MMASSRHSGNDTAGSSQYVDPLAELGFVLLDHNHSRRLVTTHADLEII
jgi:hypothetical protein